MLLEATLEKIRPLDRSAEEPAQKRLDSLTKPLGSLGRLEELARRVSCVQGKIPPEIGRKLLFVFAADHGIAREGVSAYPREVTAQMTFNFLHGGAAINVLARHFGVDVEIVDMGVDHDFAPVDGLRSYKIKHGTDSFARGPAMTRADARQSLETGIRLAEEAAARKLFLLGAGDMGIGNTASAAAILCGLTGLSVREAAGRGTGIDRETYERKVAAIESGLRCNRPNPNDPLDVLAKVGGFEIGAIAGLALGAAAFRIPMVLDGYIGSAAALLACRLNAGIKDFLFAGHLSTEHGHRAMLDELRLNPLLSLHMRLGEGTGACIAMGLIEAAVKVMREMATFESAGVAGKIS
ncbi:MAG: nicotinate-nucleotide--dimethylbenzimidazole phosphoribosyltransferase [Candidatus Binatia bacterium]